MSSKGASPLPNDSSVNFRSKTCPNHPSNPLINNQFRASGLNLAIYVNIKENLQARREKGNKGIEQQIIMKIKQFEFNFITLKGDYTQIITINLNLKALN